MTSGAQVPDIAKEAECVVETNVEGKQHHDTQRSRSIMQIARMGNKRFQAVVIAVSIVIYFLASIVVYTNLEGWDAMQCIYFAVVVVTTVGYGDFLPSSDGSKIATIFFAWFALIIVVASIDSIAKLVQSRAMKAIKADEEGLGIFNKQAIQTRRRKRCFLCALIYVLVLIIGSLVFATSIDWPEDSGDKWINGLYLTVITVTTIGFGDYSPADSYPLKVFGCCLMLIGIPISVATLGLFTQLIFGEAHEEVHLKLLEGRMTSQKFHGLHDFVTHIRAEGVGNYRNQGNGQISRFEYLCFMLVENQVLELKNIQNVMKNFEKIDKNHEGFITERDVQHSERSGGETPVGADRAKV